MLNVIFSSDSKILMGARQTAGNTQYTHFGTHSSDAGWAAAAADTHYAVPFFRSALLLRTDSDG